jgi:hypothetical protein
MFVRTVEWIVELIRSGDGYYEENNCNVAFPYTVYCFIPPRLKLLKEFSNQVVRFFLAASATAFGIGLG